MLGSPLLVVGLMFGAFVADKLGPTSWRLYWVAVAILLIRGAAVLWKRLQLRRMAAGFLVTACTFAALGLIGGSQRQANAAFESNWWWFVMALAAIMFLFVWEGRRSPERLRLLVAYSRTAPLRDRLIFRRVPDLRSQGPV